MESKNRLKESHIKNHMCCYFDDISKIEDFDINKILINKKLIINLFQFTALHTKLQLILNLYILDSIKYMDLLQFMMGLYIQYYLEKKNLIPFTFTFRYLVGVKVVKSITYIISHSYAKIKVDSYNSLPLEKKDFS